MNDVVIQNRYILTRKLGAGSMGEVYIASDRLTGQEVALKRVLNVLPIGTNLSRYTALALTNEFQMLASLRHPNIVNVLDYGIDQEGLPFLTMAYLRDGVSLLRAGAGKSVNERVALILQVLDALKYLNRRGIVHRDLKPENILVMPDNTVRVLDFGLATKKLLSERSDVSGTIAYMAPELLTGGTPTVQTDLYSVGVMAYEMFTQKHPYHGTGVQELVFEILNSELDVRLLVDAISRLPSVHSDALRETREVEPVLDDKMIGAPTIILNDLDSLPAAEGTSAHPHNASMGFASPYEIVNIVSRLLARKAADRYSDPQQVIDDLCRVIGVDRITHGAASRESFLQAATFVGRQDEIGQLDQALDAAFNSRGSLWLVGGESGVGKSRLVNEIRHLGMIKGALVLTGEIPPEGAQPFQLWRDAVKRLLLQTQVSDADAAALKLLVPDIERLLSRTLTPDDSAPPSTVEDAVLNLFRAHTDPILLILEDLHWAAPESLKLLQTVHEQQANAKLLIIGNYRIDEMQKLADQLPGSKHIKLSRLDQTATAELVVSMVGKSRSDARFIAALQRETEGNVFFLIETVRALAEESGTLEGISAQSMPSNLLTGGMQKIIQHRLDRVPEPYRPLLNIAALSGRELEIPILKQVSGSVDVEEWLTTLANAAVVEFQNERWRFAHDKLRESLTQMLSDEECITLHRQLALTLEALYPDDQRADALVIHWRGAGETDKEIHYIRIAGRRAEQMGAYDEARRLYERALELAHDPTLQIEFNSLLGGLYEYRSEYGAAEKHLTLALSMAREHQQTTQIADVLDKLAWIHIRHGQMDEADEKAAEVLKLAREAGNETAILHGLSLSGIVHHIRGEMQQAYDLFIEGLPIAERSGESYTLATHLNSLGAAQEGIGRAEDAIQTLTRASELAQQLGNPALLGNIEGNLGHLLYNQRQFPEAHIHFLTALLSFRKAGNAYGDALAGYYLGYIMLHMGDTSHACQYLRDSLKFSLEIGAVTATLGGLVGAAEYYRIQGNSTRAAELIGLVRAHPATASDADVQREAELVYGKLSNADVQAAIERGEKLPLEETARHEADSL